MEGISSDADKYYENDNAIAFSSSYGHDIYFVGILPKESGEFNLSELDIDGLLKSEQHYDVINATMPKLKYETSYNFEKLKELGLDKMFHGNEEMNGFIENDNVYVSRILQKCTIDLDEYGTEASAATAIIMDKNCAIIGEQKTVDVDLNRPFAYLIYDSKTNQVLFMGKVVDF